MQAAISDARSPLRLTRLLIGVRLRMTWNALRWRRAGPTGLALFIGVVTSAAYVGLFWQAFRAIVATIDLAGQGAALSLIVGTIAIGSLAAKAAGGDAVVAGSPENEFLLARPTSLPALVVARSLAGAVTDPFGALFVFPVLVAAAIAWNLGATAWLVAALTSMTVQVGISAAAQTVQIAIVRYTRRRRRNLAWVFLRLFASLSLAALWMTGTWVLRAPRAMAESMAALGGALRFSPGAAITAPLLALRQGRPGAVAAALLALGAATGVVLAIAYAVARRAGMHGWEEAGAVWAETDARPAQGGRVLTAATKDLRLLTRDRSQLLALVATPIIFVGIQVFGAAGWAWSTASLQRVAFLSFSLCLYMATIGPLAHMQAERRAFWILRTVPVSVARLMAAKARTWSLLLGGLAGAIFLVLSMGVAGATWPERIGTAALVVAGAIGMAWLAVGLACQSADLSDEQRPAIGPATVYLFLLVGGLYNLVLADAGAERVRGLIVYLFAAAALWLSGMAQAEVCLDPEARLRRQVRPGDAALFVLLFDMGRRAALAVTRMAGQAQLRNGGGGDGDEGAVVFAATRAGVTVLVGILAAIYLLRRPWPAARRKLAPSIAIALGLGAVLVLLARVTGAGLPAIELLARVWPAVTLAVTAVLILIEELILRGAFQRALQEHFAGRIAPRRAAVVAALAAVAIGCVTSDAPLAITIASQSVASFAYATTNRISTAWLARFTLAVVALAIARR